MASEIRSFQVTIPPGTPQSAPFTQAIVFPPRTVTQVDWKVPPGPSGLMGWALTIAGQAVIPNNAGAYIVADDEARSWPLTGFPDQGQWQVTGYNTGNFPHTIYLDFLLEQNASPSGQPAQISNADLSSQLPGDQLAVPPLPDLTLAAG